MPTPQLQAQIDIAAPASQVWALISDLRRMPEWSPQCRVMKPLGPVAPGTRTINLNRRGKFMFWPTTARITEVIPEQKLAFKVDGNHAIWSYELRPADGGTTLIETRHAENGIAPISNAMVSAFMGGVPGFEAELLDGMKTSLAKIKTAAER